MQFIPQGQILRQYQSHVLGPRETVYYDKIVMSCYSRQDIQIRPFIGFRVLLRDMGQANAATGAERLHQLDSAIPNMLVGTGCFLREAKRSIMPDGIWLVSAPVPNICVTKQIRTIMSLLRTFEYYFGFTWTGIFEVSMSGRISEAQFYNNLKNLSLNAEVYNMLVRPDDNQFSHDIGVVIPLNQFYTLVKTRWNANNSTISYAGLSDHMELIALKLSSLL